MLPLEGEDLKEFQEDLKNLQLLIVDEVSMVSRVFLAQIHDRLREWRLANGQHDLAEEPFGGVAVILAGDFGQLPPVPPLLHSITREQKASNHGLRLLNHFDTVLRLPRIHSQPRAYA